MTACIKQSRLASLYLVVLLTANKTRAAEPCCSVLCSWRTVAERARQGLGATPLPVHRDGGTAGCMGTTT